MIQTHDAFLFIFDSSAPLVQNAVFLHAFHGRARQQENAVARLVTYSFFNSVRRYKFRNRNTRLAAAGCCPRAPLLQWRRECPAARARARVAKQIWKGNRGGELSSSAIRSTLIISNLICPLRHAILINN